ncbi:MAG TPA: BON domain-containing protein [Pyrinomonadaceae bacterium]
MSYDEGQARRSKVVVETPTSRREVEQTESVNVPARAGVSATTVGVLVVLVVALVTILVLLLMNNQSTDTANANIAAQQPTPIPQTTIIQQPAQQAQPPIIIQQPAPATQPAPIIVTPPSGGMANSGTDDSVIQADVDKKIADDPTISTLGVTATVLNGKVMLVGTVKSEALKAQVEKLVKSVRGVKQVDNQITVM